MAPKRSGQIHSSAQLLLVTTWKRAMKEGELGTIWSPQNGEGGRKGGKGAAAPPRHLTPTWGWFGPILCTRARSSFGTGPTCPGKSRARRRGQSQGLSLQYLPLGTSATAPVQGSLTFPPSKQGHGVTLRALQRPMDPSGLNQRI